MRRNGKLIRNAGTCSIEALLLTLCLIVLTCWPMLGRFTWR
jgi:hypothetical protein